MTTNFFRKTLDNMNERRNARPLAAQLRTTLQLTIENTTLAVFR